MNKKTKATLDDLISKIQILAEKLVFHAELAEYKYPLAIKASAACIEDYAKEVKETIQKEIAHEHN